MVDNILNGQLEVEPLAAFNNGREFDTPRPIHNGRLVYGRLNPDGTPQYDSGDPKELQRQNNALADRLGQAIRKCDRLEAANISAHTRIVGLNLKVWIIVGALAAQFAVIGFLATELFARIH